MIVREDFVTNSSTTNYIIIGIEISVSEIKNYDAKEITIIDEEGYVSELDELAKWNEERYESINNGDETESRYFHSYYTDTYDGGPAEEINLSEILKKIPDDVEKEDIKIISGSYYS